MEFQVRGLPAAPFADLFGLSDEALARRGVIRRHADRRPGFPCRVSLRDADPGESVLLLNYEHLPVDSPYRSRHAIYVRERAQQAHPARNEVPQSLATRLLSLRAFDAAGLLVQAEVAPGSELAGAAARLLAPREVVFMHAHYAGAGCYAARIDRAG